MQIYDNKEKVRQSTPLNEPENRVCGKCGHKRTKNENGPSWQCPGCHAAYEKVSEEHIRESNRKLEVRYSKYLEKSKRNADLKSKIKATVDSTLALGVGARLLSGTARACSCAGAVLMSPLVVKVLGAVLIVGAIIYLVAKYAA